MFVAIEDRAAGVRNACRPGTELALSRAHLRSSHLVAAWVGAAVAWGWSAPGRAQSGECRIAVDSTAIGLGQTLRVDVTCRGQGAEMGMPVLAVPDFEELSRQVSRPMQFSFGMGGQPQIIESTTRLTLLLRPRREGSFDIGPARARIGNLEVASGVVRVSVGAGASGVPAPSNPSPPTLPSGPPSGPLDGAVYDDYAFLRTVVDRRESVVGEQVTVTFYLYARALTSQPQITRQPATDGFWVHELLDRNQPPEPVMQRVGNASFRVYTLRRFAAFPMRPGTLTIGAMQMQVPYGNPLDVFFGAPQASLERASVPIDIHVQPLPPGAPSGLPTHVGTLAAELAVDRSQVPTGEAVTVQLRLSGRGHVTGLEVPSLQVDGLRVLSPEVDQRTTVQGEWVGGDKTVRWLVVPERAGTFAIGPFRWAVFEPATGAWTTVETEARTLIAAGNPLPTARDEPRVETERERPAGGDEEELAAVMGPIRTNAALARRRQRIADGPWYPAALAAGPLLVVVLAGTRVAMRRRLASEAASEADRRARQARAKLESARDAMRAADTRAFHTAIYQGLSGLLEVRLGRSIGSLTHSELRKYLVARGMDADLARRLAEELEGAEMARFSAAAGEREAMEATWARVRALLGEIERFRPIAEEH